LRAVWHDNGRLALLPSLPAPACLPVSPRRGLLISTGPVRSGRGRRTGRRCYTCRGRRVTRPSASTGLPRGWLCRRRGGGWSRSQGRHLRRRIGCRCRLRLVIGLAGLHHCRVPPVTNEAERRSVRSMDALSKSGCRKQRLRARLTALPAFAWPARPPVTPAI